MTTPLRLLPGRGLRTKVPTPEGEMRRALLLAVIQENPGLTFRGVYKAAGIANGAAQYHLARLRGRKAVVCYAQGASHRYFPAGWDAARAAEAVLARDPRMREALQVAQRGRLRQLDFIAALGWPRASVQHTLRRLVKAEALRIVRQGRCALYEVAEDQPADALLDAREDLHRLETAFRLAERAGNAAAFYATVRRIAGVGA